MHTDGQLLYMFLCFLFSGDFTCAREVSTVVCAHEPDCLPRDCNGHGECRMGLCVCDSHWTGAGCDVQMCKETNCSTNGVCTEGDWKLVIVIVDLIECLRIDLYHSTAALLKFDQTHK